uniref:F-box associated domain-containing protein n=1 Tax=Setaria viridis TaxID=4556 RepID=A0A4U6W347_SETVI|nr:hypothetical protein SEVIR_1G010900v2 [Setaria viridis]
MGVYGDGGVIEEGAVGKSSFRLLNLATGAVYALPERIVASTGEYKVLRVIDRLSCGYPEQIFEVFTLDSGINARWRAAQYNVTFLFWRTVFVEEEGHIGSFDLETDEWRPCLTGPLSSLTDGGFGTDELSLAAMNGCLVVVHRCYSANIDLWFLMDFERGLWVKQHSIQVELGVQQHVVHSISRSLVGVK